MCLFCYLSHGIVWKSSFFDRLTYKGFLVSWIIEGSSAAAGFLILVIVGSIYIGMVLYIAGMVKDMRMRIVPYDSDFAPESHQPLNQIKAWLMFAREIEFHAEILR